MIQEEIRKLTAYGILTGLVPEEDEIYTVNSLLALFGEDAIEDAGEPVQVCETDLEGILQKMLDYAYEAGMMEENTVAYRDLMDTKIMSTLLPRPSEVIRRFYELYRESPQKATDDYYKFSCASASSFLINVVFPAPKKPDTISIFVIFIPSFQTICTIPQRSYICKTTFLPVAPLLSYHYNDLNFISQICSFHCSSLKPGQI